MEINKMNKTQLIEYCEQKGYPKTEWENLKVKELKDYIIIKEETSKPLEEEVVEEEEQVEEPPQEEEEQVEELPQEEEETETVEDLKPPKKRNLFKRHSKRYN